MPHGLDILSQIAGLAIQCSTLITVIYTFVKFTQKPTADLDTRVSELEQWMRTTDERLQQGNVHFKANDESNRVTQNALFAIMDAMGQMDSVPPSAREEIQQRKKDLMDYLTDR